MSAVKLSDHIILQFNGKDVKLDSSSVIEKEELGKGLDGEVIHAILKEQNFHLAIKKVFLHSDEYTENDRQNIARAVLRLTGVHHSAYVIDYYGVFFPNNSEAWICKELMDLSLETLMQKCKSFNVQIPEIILAKLAYNVLTVVQYLDTSLGILHRRVKPNNILLNRAGEIKLCCKDWNILSDLPTKKGARKNYTAPERLEGDERPNSRGDVWSLGICLVEVVTGVFPYAKEAKTLFEQLYQIVTEPPPELIPGPNCSAEMCDFVSKCLTKDQKDRPRPLVLLNHPWIKDAKELHVRDIITQLIDMKS